MPQVLGMGKNRKSGNPQKKTKVKGKTKTTIFTKLIFIKKSVSNWCGIINIWQKRKASP